MTTKALLAAILLLQAFPASAQLASRIPLWADSALGAAGLMPSSELNPPYALGDLDRDGLLDLAVEVKDQDGLRCGVAILHQIDRSVHIVGAGRPVGNGKDEVPCGGWSIRPVQHSHRGGTFGPDLLYVAAAWDPGGWLVWNGAAYTWVPWD